MADNAEYNRLVNEKTARQNEYNACVQRIDDYEYLLRRLRTARDTVNDLKNQFNKDVQRKDKGFKNDDLQWKGAQRDTYKRKMETLVNANETYYKKTLDYVLDQLNWEITRIKNLQNDEYGLLGWLDDRINNLGTMIVNFFN